MDFSDLKKLCPPALLYLVLSLILLVVMIFQSSASISYLLGHSLIYLVFIAFWTWILHLICGAGYKWVSWVLVLLPIIVYALLFFIDLTALVSSNMVMSSMSGPTSYMMKR
jgi:hypothetical protein